MLVRFVVFILCLFAVSAKADRRLCDQLLSSTALSTNENSTAPQLSDSAQAFVNIIQLYAQKAEARLSERAINAILNSNAFINPLAGSIDSFSQQASKAIEQLRKSIDANDWLQIQNRIHVLNKKSQAENKERKNKEDDTSGVYAPKVVAQEFLEEEIGFSPVWHNVGNKSYVAIGVANKFQVFELVGDKLEIRFFGDDSKQDRITGLSWQTVNGQTFIATNTDAGQLFLYKFFNNAVLSLDSQKVLEGVVHSSPSWQIVGDRTFLTVTASDQHLYLYELKGEILESRGSVVTRGTSFNQPKWQVIGEKVFLAATTNAGTGGGFLMLYELIQDHLEVRGESPQASNPFYGPASWQVVGDKVFLAAGSENHHLYLYELVDDQLKLKASRKTRGITSSPAWLVVDDRVFMAVGSGNKRVYLYELVGQALKNRGSVKTEGFIGHAPAWLFVNNQILLVVNSSDQKIYYYNFVNDHLEFLSSQGLRIWSSQSPSWQIKDGNAYLAAAGIGKRIILIKVYSKLRKQGGHR